MRRALALLIALCGLLAGAEAADALTSGQRLLLLGNVHYDPSTLAWVNAVKVAGGTVSQTQEQRVNKLIVDLKSAGLFQVCDRIWLHAAEDTQQALIDIVNEGVAINHGAAFVASQGFTGNGSSEYIDSGFQSDANYTQNSASIATYVTNSRTASNFYAEIGNNSTATTVIVPNTSGATEYDVNSGTAGTAAVSNAQGFWLASRTSSTSYSLYEDGSSTALGTTTASAQAPPAVNFYILAQNNNGGVLNASADTVTNTDICGGLTGAQAAQFQNIINDDYMIPLGINVYGPVIFGDSVNGSDTNSGVSAAQAVQSLTQITTLALASAARGERPTIYLARGSDWRASLNLSTIANVQVVANGSGAPPIDDGSDVETSWTLSSGQTVVYQTSVSGTSLDANDRYVVYENGTPLQRVESEALVASTPGSFLDENATNCTNPCTIYIQASDSGNPSSNGKTYEVTTRPGIVLGTNGQVSGVQAQKQFDVNGSIDLIYAAANGSTNQVNDSLAVWGTKHNLTLGAGNVSNSIAWGFDEPTPTDTSNDPFTNYEGSIPANSPVTYDRCGVILPQTITSGAILGALYSHSADGSNFSSAKVTQCWASGDFDVTMPGAVPSWQDLAVNGFYANLTRDLAWGEGAVRYGLAYNTYQFGNQTNLQNNSIQDSVAFVGERGQNANYIGIFAENYPEVLSFTDDDIVVGTAAGSTFLFNTVGTPSGNQAVNGYVMFGGNAHLDIESGVMYVGDHNVFFVWDINAPSDQFYSKYDGTTYSSLGTWQAATGQDADSVYLAAPDQTASNPYAFWLGISTNADAGPSAGDFRINPSARVYDGAGNPHIGQFPDGMPITQAGAQNHWDWTTDAPAAGPPTRFPTVPLSLADSQSFVGNPGGWNFYP